MYKMVNVRDNMYLVKYKKKYYNNGESILQIQINTITTK